MNVSFDARILNIVFFNSEVAVVGKERQWGKISPK